MNDMDFKVIGLALRWLLTISVLVHGTLLPVRMLQELGKRANVLSARYDQMEAGILASKIHLTQGTPAWYLGASHTILPEVRNLTHRAIRSETVAMMLVAAMNMTPHEAVAILPSMGPAAFGLCDSNSEEFFEIIESCESTICPSRMKYRSQSGRCNNPKHSNWGTAFESYVRLLPAEYADGVSLPRFLNLPSARDVSLGVHSGLPDQPHPHLMALAALFGQFIAYDLSHTPKVELPDGTKLKCCDVSYEHFHSECFPIKTGDNTATHCMEYTRSAPDPGNISEGCRLGPRQQINQATSYLDLSSVYGISDSKTRVLRSGVGGRLKTQRKNLPMPSAIPGSCRSDIAAFPCFYSGDARVNEHPGLALIHLLFIREHNKVAARLESLNCHWNDDTLFEEARRIVIAELQHITYNEFLPVVLGESALDRWNLRLKVEGFFGGYQPQTDATLSNAAASVGLLFVAAITPKTIDLVDTRSKKFVKFGERSLLSSFYAPQELYEAGAIDRLIAGVTASHSRKPMPPGLNEIFLGRYFHDGKSSENPIDLVAQLIQRGRDHGLPPYTKWRTFCGMPDVSTFADLRGTISVEAIRRLRLIYGSVKDVDLVTGAFAEAPIEGSIIGPTFSCLLGRTFRNIRFGDRYWYENGNTPGAFTLEQLEEIRKSSMAMLLCNNGDHLEQVQPRSFILSDPFLNPVSNCSRLTNLDLTPWKERLTGNDLT
ncbi:peroxidase isoform X1 [Neodiprion pinetum]|uniref:peroxidase isoform X1 n=1 Tax=Neodiprion pinetum TaxID=441929 RepID=UPI001EDFB7B6|nr:peroxidase-like isoform X2 [Neodiprion pinetum]